VAGRQGLDAFDLATEVSDCGRRLDDRGRGLLLAAAFTDGSLLLAAVFTDGGRALGSGDRGGGAPGTSCVQRSHGHVRRRRHGWDLRT
jgi:hypothetical protein